MLVALSDMSTIVESKHLKGRLRECGHNTGFCPRRYWGKTNIIRAQCAQDAANGFPSSAIKVFETLD